MEAQKSAEGIVGRCSTRPVAGPPPLGPELSTQRRGPRLDVREEQKMRQDPHAASEGTGRNPGGYDAVRQADAAAAESRDRRRDQITEAAVARG